MAELDRAAVLELLNRLGSGSDEAVLQAARELSGKLTEAGMTWDEILRPDGANTDDAEHDAPFDETVLAESGTGGVSAEDRAEVGRLVERLLARKNLSETMREDLTEFKRSIADGSIEAMDCKYIRALARRLDA